MNKNNFSWIGDEIISYEEINALVQRLASEIDRDYLDSPEELVVIGVMRGAFIFEAQLVMAMQTAIDIDFITTHSYGKNETTPGELKLLTDLQVDIADKNVLVVDDIIDTGRTIKFIDNYLRARNPKSIEYCMLLDKAERRDSDFNIPIKYIGKQVPDVFVLGYGLDGAHVGRNVEGIFGMKGE